jgi:hypothetical protein
MRSFGERPSSFAARETAQLVAADTPTLDPTAQSVGVDDLGMDLLPHDDGARAERGGGSGRGVCVLHGGRERLGALLRRRRVHPHDLPAVAVEVEEAA